MRRRQCQIRLGVTRIPVSVHVGLVWIVSLWSVRRFPSMAVATSSTNTNTRIRNYNKKKDTSTSFYDPSASLYQHKDGYLCLPNDGGCWDGEDQDEIIMDQIAKGALEDCYDILDDCDSRIAQLLSTSAPAANTSTHICQDDFFLESYCTVSCQACHTLTFTVPEEQSMERLRRQNYLWKRKLYLEGEDAEIYYGPYGPRFVERASVDSHKDTSTTTTTDFIEKLWSSKRSSRRTIIDAIGSDLGVPQYIINATESQISKVLQDARTYITDYVMTDDLYVNVRDKCRLHDPLCALWAVQGKCDDEDFWNTKLWDTCAPICGTCEELHYTARCPVNMNQRHAWYPGELHAMFTRIVNDPYIQEHHPVEVWSRPDYANNDTEETADYDIGPWLITLDNFVTPEEADRLIELGAAVGYERSEDVGAELEDGENDGVVSDFRTSSNAWCDPESCESDPLVDALVARVENITHLHRNYSEHMQLLQYQEGQHYDYHHDYIDIDKWRRVGVRILTVYFYLNDVEAGGETAFPELDLAVTPKKGRAVLWPSVDNDNPHERDWRTAHQALPVQKGIKYGANYWFHQRQFRVDFDKGC